MPPLTSRFAAKVITRVASFVLLLLICFPVHARSRLQSGRRTPGTARSNAQEPAWMFERLPAE